MFEASNTVRLLFVNIAVVSLVGIGLTGFGVVHWFAYVLPGFMLFAAITGFCPGLLLSGKLLQRLGVKP